MKKFLSLLFFFSLAFSAFSGNVLYYSTDPDSYILDGTTGFEIRYDIIRGSGDGTFGKSKVVFTDTSALIVDHLYDVTISINYAVYTGLICNGLSFNDNSTSIVVPIVFRSGVPVEFVFSAYNIGSDVRFNSYSFVDLGVAPPDPVPPVLNVFSAPDMIEGETFSYTPTCSQGDTPITYTITSESWLSITNGVVTGVAPLLAVDEQYRTHTFDITATNAAGSDTKTITFDVLPAPPPSPDPPIFTGSLAISVVADTDFTFNLNQYFTGDTFNITISGFPDWVTLNNDGTITGHAPLISQEETWQVTVNAVNTSGSATGSGTFSIVLGDYVDPESNYYITSTSSVDIAYGDVFEYTITTNSTLSGETYSISGAPSWLSSNGLNVGGSVVPDGITGFSFTVHAAVNGMTCEQVVRVNLSDADDPQDSDDSDTPNHIKVDNFDDLDLSGIINAINSTNGKLTEINSSVQANGGKLDVSINILGSILDSNIDRNSRLDSIDSKLDNLAYDDSNVLASLNDIKASLTTTLTPDAGVENPNVNANYDLTGLTPTETTMEIESANKPVINDYQVVNAMRSRSAVAPVMVLPFATLNDGFDDISLDFSTEPFNTIIASIRMIILGCLFYFMLMRMWAVTRRITD